MDLNSIDPQLRNIVLKLEELRGRRSPHYPAALESIITRLPAGCDEITRLRQHQAKYIKSLEAQQ